MELRKEKEIAYYDQLAKIWCQKHPKQNQWTTDIEDYDIYMFSSYRYCRNWFKENIKPGIKFLDYGCGHGMHSILPTKLGAEVYGIDLSEESLEIAQERATLEEVGDKIKFIKMDCELMDFPDNYFDLIWDGGTFSSLDINKAFPELARILKPGGKLIGIETFGHNPLMNFKRWLNKKIGKRTGWATEHIIKNKDLKLAQKYFKILEIRYFHLFSMLVFPFRRLPGGKILFRIIDCFDSALLKIPLLKRYAFRIVFVWTKK